MPFLTNPSAWTTKKNLKDGADQNDDQSHDYNDDYESTIP